MKTIPRVTAEMIRDTLGRATYMAIFDDAGSGSVATVDASNAVAMVIRRAHTRVESRLLTVFERLKLPVAPTALDDDLLLDAELNYACALSFDRHPEYVRAYGEEPRRRGCYDQAEHVMELLQAAILRLAEVPVETKPSNVGGTHITIDQRVMLPNLDGSLNSGDF